MTAYYIDWLNLLLRWLHLVTGIAWIGASFYFIWLDNSLEEPSPENKEKGIGGQLSSIHAGGFYEVGKYTLAPAVLPTNLHWFKWEAYSTWISGFFLFVLMFYVGADVYLLDPSKKQLPVWQGVSISLFVLIGGWISYDLLCKSPLANKPWGLAIILLGFIATLSWLLHQIFSDRAAYLHIGALIGTCMAANVFFVIMPGQRALVAAVSKGEKPDIQYAKASKLRSIHNNYLTLPVLFIMISNHYPMTYGHEHAPLVLLAIVLLGALARHFFNLKHKGVIRYEILISAFLGVLLLAWAISPRETQNVSQESFASDQQAFAIINKRCVSCHSQNTTDEVFTSAQAGVMFDTEEQIIQWKSRIISRVVVGMDMPLMNKTKMTKAERDLIERWGNSVGK